MHGYISHHSQGRVRLRIPEAKHDLESLESMARAVRHIAGVSSAEFNPATGSLLILYAQDALTDLAPITNVLAQNGTPLELIAASTSLPDASFGEESSVAANLIASLARALDLAVKSATNNQLDLRVMLPIGAAAGCGLYALSNAAAPTPLWLTLAIFAVTSFVALNQIEPGGLAEAASQSPGQRYLH